MNLLFVIGNGFDLQLGLPTSYSDFYKYYISRPSQSEVISRLKGEISQNQQNWSDLELALGKISANYSDVDTFCEVYDDIQTELQRYLLKLDELMQAGTLTINSDEGSLKIGIQSPEKYFSKEVQESITSKYNQFFARDKNYQINVQILSFNYTHTIEYLLSISRLPYYISDRNKMHITHLRHIHRDISPSNSVWLGVDNEAQILNQGFQTNEAIRLRLIKPEILSESPIVINNIAQTISDADVICLFGTSLGATDQTWVQKIAEKISKGALTMMFLKDDNTYRTDNAKLVYQRRYKNVFIEKMNNLGVPIDEEHFNLYVEINSSIFKKDNTDPHDENLKILLEQLR